MINQHSGKAQPRYPGQVCVYSMWKVVENEEYKIKRIGINEEHYVAICTFGGSGTIKISCSSMNYILENDSIFVIRISDILHYQTTYNFWDFRWVEFYTKDILPCPIYLINSEKDSQRLLIMESMFEALTRNQSAYASALFNVLLTGWIECCKQQPIISSKMQDIAGYIQSLPLNKQISVQELAQKFHMSERMLRIVFYRAYQMTPKAYMLECKLSSAKTLLQTTNMPISEISERIGYSSQYYFSKAFKIKYGISPLGFRNKG